MRKEDRKKVLQRLKIISGQIKGLEKMIGEDKYCVHVITQTSAVRKALSGVEDLLLEGHLATHVVEQMKKKGTRSKAVNEIVELYKLAKNK